MYLRILSKNKFITAGVAKLADAPDLGSGGAIHGGSSPFARTLIEPGIRHTERQTSFSMLMLKPKQNQNEYFKATEWRSKCHHYH